MRKNSTHSRIFETLESRCLLSATAAPATPLLTSAVTAVTATASAPRIVGNYTGSATLGMPGTTIQMKFAATWVIKTQTSTTLTGTINIDGLVGTGTFTGTIDSKGNFKYTVPVRVGASKQVLTIKGHVSGKTLTGTVTFTKGTMIVLTGPFSFTRN